MPRQLVVSGTAVGAMSRAVFSFRLLGSVMRRLGAVPGFVLRLGLAYLPARRLRTSLTLLAYALIIFTLVFSSVLSGLFSSRAKELTAEEGGGFDVLASASSADPAGAEDLAAEGGVEAMAPLSWTVTGFRVGGSSSDAFRDWAISGFDRALLDGAFRSAEVRRGGLPERGRIVGSGGG